MNFFINIITYTQRRANTRFRPKPPRRHQRHVRSPRHPTPQIEHIFPFPGVCSRTCIHAVSCAYFLPAAHGVNRESESPSSPLRFRRAGPVPGECSRHAMLHTPPPLSAVAPQPRVAPRAALHPRSCACKPLSKLRPRSIPPIRERPAHIAQRTMYRCPDK